MAIHQSPPPNARKISEKSTALVVATARFAVRHTWLEEIKRTTVRLHRTQTRTDVERDTFEVERTTVPRFCTNLPPF